MEPSEYPEDHYDNDQPPAKAVTVVKQPAPTVYKAQNAVPEPVAPTAAERRQNEVSAALDPAYAKASELRLTEEDGKALSAPFPDDAVEIRPFDGLIYIPHIFISERLNKVLGPGQWSMVRRREFREGNRIYAEWVLKIRGCFVGESVGAQDYQPTNPKANYSDALEGTRGEAIRRICGKDLSCGHQVWKPQYAREWVSNYATPVWAQNANTREKKKMWRLKDALPIDMFPWRETGLYGLAGPTSPASPQGGVQTRPEAPNPPTAKTGRKPDQDQEFADPPPGLPPDQDPDLGDEPAWVRGEEEAAAPAPEKPGDDSGDEPWRAFPIPFDWGKGKPDCIPKGTLLADVPKNKLWGMWKIYEPKPWKGEISAADKAFRRMLDMAGAHYEFTAS